jgi:hypothetical protein
MKEIKPNRSIAQNAKLWVLYTEIATQLSELTGEIYTAHHIHMYNLQHLMGQEIVKFNIGDKECYFLENSSTRTKSVQEFGEMLEKLISYFVSIGLKINEDNYK